MNGSKTTRGKIHCNEHTGGDRQHDDGLDHVRPKRSPQATGRTVGQYGQRRDHDAGAHIQVKKYVECLCCGGELRRGICADQHNDEQPGKLSDPDTARSGYT